MGVDKVIDKLIKKLGKVKSAYLIGDYAKGIDSGLIDIVLIGSIKIDELDRMAKITSENINRKIRYIVFSNKEIYKFWNQLQMDQAFLLWGKKVV